MNSDHYTHLRQDAACIRLLHLNPANTEAQPLVGSLSVALLEDQPKYIAVSYTWGEPIFSHSLNCNGTPLFITKNLFQALKRFRYTGELVFWIDQICINQADFDERRFQVSLMGRIYKQAKLAFIWLGDDDGNTKKVVAIADHLLSVGAQNSRSLSTWEITHDGKRLEKPWLHLMEFFRKPWFCRVWIVQEFVLARDIRIFCGEYEIPWQVIYSSSLITGLPTAVMNEMSSPVIFNVQMVIVLLALREDITLKTDLHQLIQILGEFRNFQSTDPRDKIFGFLGLFHGMFDLPSPEYKSSVENVYRRYARYFIKHDQGPEIIEQADISRALHPRSALPSWCPDWTLGILNTWKSDEDTFDASLGTKAQMTLCNDERFIDMKGGIVDEVTTLGPVLDLGSDWEQRQHFQEAIENFYDWNSHSALILGLHLHDIDSRSQWIRLITEFFKTTSKSEKFQDFIVNYYTQVLQTRYSIGSEIASPDDDRRNTTFIYIMRMVLGLINGLRLCISKKGYFGLTGRNPEKGDFITVIFGLRMPRVLRKDQTMFQIICKAWILDIMHGEALNIEHFQEHLFTIR